MPNTNKGGGISRKIIELKFRKKLKETVSKLNIKKGMGVIIRTAGESMSLKEIKLNPSLSNLALIKQSRLSVMPVDPKSWKIICKSGEYNL